MKKITLVCAGGFSTSLLVTKMEQAAKEKGLEVVIRATAQSKFKEFENDTDVLLLGPQVSYLVDELKEKYKEYKSWSYREYRLWHDEWRKSSKLCFKYVNNKRTRGN